MPHFFKIHKKMEKKRLYQILLFAAVNNLDSLKDRVSKLYPEITTEDFFTNSARLSNEDFTNKLSNWIFANDNRKNKVIALSVKYDENKSNLSTNSEAKKAVEELPSNRGKAAPEWVIQVGEMLGGSTTTTVSKASEMKTANVVVIVVIGLVLVTGIYLIFKS